MTRDIAHIIIEAQTPLKVGSNASDFLQDSPVQKDFNNLPMILGTSLAGVLRKEFSHSEAKELFGEKDGSKVIFSNALLVDENNKVQESLLLKKSPFLTIFEHLPIREHTVISSKGVSDNKFDEEVVYKGTRFKFSIELIEDDKESFERLLSMLSLSSLRFGGGSTKGFGKFKVLSIESKRFDAQNYLTYSSSLNYVLRGESRIVEAKENANYTKYTLKITPEDFFMFGSGFGDSDADATPVYEKVVDYASAKLFEEMILIPASSIKGALAHRTTFHYNSLIGNTIEAKNGIDNITEIFGEAKNSKKEIDGSKGKVIFSDDFQTKEDTKVFDHVSIDRFTGGAKDGALFQEKTIADDREYEIEILLHKDVNDKEREAFENALEDITIGMLPLGGATTKGHGVFTGSWSKDGE